MPRRFLVMAIALFIVGCGGSQTTEQPLTSDGSSSFGEGESAIEQGDFSRAAGIFTRIVKKDPQNAKAHYYLGLAKKNLDDLEGAEEEYRLAIDYDADLLAAHNNLGLLLLEKGDLKGAETELSTYLEKQTEDAEAHFNYALLQEAKGDLATAKEHYRQAAKLDPEDAAPWLGLGDLARTEKDLKSALDYYRKGLAIDSQMPELAIREGQTLLDLKRLDDAAKALCGLAEMNRSGPELLSTAGVLLAKYDKDEAALTLYRAALERDDNYATAHFLLANALARKKEFSQAIKHYERFIELAGDRPEVATAKERLKACRSQTK